MHVEKKSKGRGRKGNCGDANTNKHVGSNKTYWILRCTWVIPAPMIAPLWIIGPSLPTNIPPETEKSTPITLATIVFRSVTPGICMS